MLILLFSIVQLTLFSSKQCKVLHTFSVCTLGLQQPAINIISYALLQLEQEAEDEEKANAKEEEDEEEEDEEEEEEGVEDLSLEDLDEDEEYGAEFEVTQIM